MKKVKIAITGTPGTGKTTVSKILSKKLNLPLYHLSDMVKEKFNIGYDSERECFIADVASLKKFFLGIDRFIAEGIVAHCIPCDVIFVFRTHPDILRERLSKRGYSKEKIYENVEAEKLDVCLNQCAEVMDLEKIIQIDTTDKTPEEISSMIIRISSIRNKVYS